MAQENATTFEGFSSLFNKSVPHILESIFFSLDGSSLMACLQVCKVWNELLSSEPYKKKISDIRKNEANLIGASCSGNIGEIIHLLSIGVDPNCIGNNATPLMMGTPLHFAATGPVSIGKDILTPEWSSGPLQWSENQMFFSTLLSYVMKTYGGFYLP